MIRFNRNDSLINSDLLPPAGDFNFTFKVPFHFFYIFKHQLSLFCLKYQNIIYLFVTVSAIRNKISITHSAKYCLIIVIDKITEI